ncbi:tryptophan synthase, alpha chain [Leifsonia sp. 98AMF]|uniref:tryptophan synthase subunit alpha n=1 Tax=unclassified Leifsonia TaxID=2663824 RepID=UPI000879E6CC|nr:MULTISPECIES: tryptophan synthase subunit alpha [unclassified Leifsonia]SDH38909.1 tryptophan synthase, alpha chain [Leifsonia sp. 197AMF]SDI97384.1 tryptophan synthase, alpha chain [Leifsonia sp. 466MF]SDJ77988.1 tryptophan synthase, alpha chain [Leifsonia sp. 157MF]SDO00699.1 tryptophan synthase, alpha chain [Leifsonia sp. 509MF]SEN03408.1 tryptophan synthase, alpha chain [Leifsonia sp. 467MF]
MSGVVTSRVAAAIARRNTEASGALIGYLPAGFPDLATSVDAAVALANNGVDVIELGLPYSDPVMDGTVIQAATQQALRAGFRLRDGFTAVREITAQVDIPVLVMTYWNPVLQYGVDRFADDLAAAGGAGLITPDLIPDEGADWLAASDRVGLDRVFLAAPSSTDARLKQAVEASRGFVYAVSTMGITGARTDVDAAARTLVGRLREAGATSTCVGLGISSAAQVAEVLEYADGAIVGSALVKALGDGGVAEAGRVAAELARGTAA